MQHADGIVPVLAKGLFIKTNSFCIDTYRSTHSHIRSVACRTFRLQDLYVFVCVLYIYMCWKKNWKTFIGNAREAKSRSSSWSSCHVCNVFVFISLSVKKRERRAVEHKRDWIGLNHDINWLTLHLFALINSFESHLWPKEVFYSCRIFCSSHCSIESHIECISIYRNREIIFVRMLNCCVVGGCSNFDIYWPNFRFSLNSVPNSRCC